MSEQEFEADDDGQFDLFAASRSAAAQPAGSGGWPEAGWLPVDEDWEPDGHVPDPETDPDDEESWLTGLPADVRAEFLAGPWTGEGEALPAGFLHHLEDGPSGVGFAAGGALDALEPGPFLGRELANATTGGHGQLGESELIGVLCGWRRLSSWAAAGETAAVIALASRRTLQSGEPGQEHLLEHVGDEVAAALTVTGRSADRLLTVAGGLDRLPEVLDALERGWVDWAKACVFADELDVLADDEAARGIAARFAGRCGPGGWTTGQLRAALRRAVLAVDPGAADRRRKKARKDAEVQTWEESSGNAGLAGRELPPAEVLAADARLTALAKWLQGRGAGGTVAQLRARVYLAVLAGQPVESLLTTPADGDGDEHPEGDGADPGPTAAAAEHSTGRDADDPAGDGYDAGQTAGRDRQQAGGDDADADPSAGSGERNTGRDITDPATTAGNSADSPGASAGTGLDSTGDWPLVSGTIHLTMPLATWLGLDREPGDVAGHGPLDAGSSRDLATTMAASPATRWCLTLTDPDGRAAGHACARHGPAPGQPPIRWAAGLQARLQYLEASPCGHPRNTAGYRPPGALRHLIQARQRTCAFPGCRRPAARCDLDHTHPYDQGGLTCECNLAPLCRRHHQAKQAPGWQLAQNQPGHMTWQTPAGRVYQTAGAPYP